MNNFFDLSNRTVVITGGGGLLGEKHAEAVMKYGARTIIADYNYHRAEKISKKLNKLYGSDFATPVFVDVTDISSIEELFNNHPQIDVLINNAAKNPKVVKDKEKEWFGAIANNRFETMPIDYWNDGMNVMLLGNFLMSQKFINNFIKKNADRKNSGIILNVASDLGVIAPDQRIYKKYEHENDDAQDVKPVFYSVAKWGIIGMTKYLSTYFAKYNIRVNSLSPGGVFNDHPENFVEKLSNLIPMSRMANVDEYQGAVVFLCSEASSYMTGHNLVIDGGRTVW